jgi:hypothetical protein
MRAAALKLRHPQAAHLRDGMLEYRVCKHVRSDEHECTTTTATAATLRARLRAIAALLCKRNASAKLRKRASTNGFSVTCMHSDPVTSTCCASFTFIVVSAHDDQSTSSAAAKGSYSSAPPAAAVPAAALPLPVPPLPVSSVVDP